jgi:hypothetical protein
MKRKVDEFLPSFSILNLENQMAEKINIPEKINIEGVEYETKGLSDGGVKILINLAHTESKMREMANNKAIMTKARNAYISEIKKEIIKSKSGIDLSSLLSD